MFNIALDENQAEQLYNGSLTDVYLTDKVIPVKEFSLHHNYPNPFNPTTTIIFELPRSGHVNLETYNTLGEKVLTPVNKELNSGIHKINIDASSLPTGTYIYRIVMNKNTLSKKMTLIK